MAFPLIGVQDFARAVAHGSFLARVDTLRPVFEAAAASLSPHAQITSSVLDPNPPYTHTHTHTHTRVYVYVYVYVYVCVCVWCVCGCQGEEEEEVWQPTLANVLRMCCERVANVLLTCCESIRWWRRYGSRFFHTCSGRTNVCVTGLGFRV